MESCSNKCPAVLIRRDLPNLADAAAFWGNFRRCRRVRGAAAGQTPRSLSEAAHAD